MAPGTRYNVIVPTAYGSMIVNRNDWADLRGKRIGVGWDLMQSGMYAQGELDTLAAMIQTCRPDPVVLDIGANIGVHSLWFSSRVGANGAVHSFEAQRLIYQMLMGNLAINSIENVYARHIALGASEGQLCLPTPDFTVPRNFGGIRLLADDPNGHAAADAARGLAARREESIAMATLDGLALARIDLLKIDVEGMERDVLVGGRVSIERDRPLMQVEWPGGDQGALPAYLLDDLGYRVYQSGINLMCVPAERTDLQLAGAVEITLDALHAAFGTP